MYEKMPHLCSWTREALHDYTGHGSAPQFMYCLKQAYFAPFPCPSSQLSSDWLPFVNKNWAGGWSFCVYNAHSQEKKNNITECLEKPETRVLMKIHLQ